MFSRARSLLVIRDHASPALLIRRIRTSTVAASAPRRVHGAALVAPPKHQSPSPRCPSPLGSGCLGARRFIMSRTPLPPIRAFYGDMTDMINLCQDLRTDEDAIAACLADPASKCMVRCGGKMLCHRGVSREDVSGAANAPAFISPASSATALAPDAARVVFMGKDIASGAPVFAIDITEEAMPKAEAAVSSQGGSLEWGAVRNFGPNMSPPEAGMAAAANGVLHWLDVHRFCPTCGSSDLQVKRSGWMLQCGADGCRYRAFPRIDPAAIVLSVSTCGDWCLLGRKAAWAEGRYSCLAGFAEVGESIEAAAVREVEEESGIVLDLDSVWFEGTQPWPMPQSLMVGFGARVAPGRDVTKYCEESTEDRVVAGEVGLTEAERLPYLQPLPPPCKVDEDELEDARWFHRDYMEARIVHDPPTMPGPFFIPGRHSLAFELITRWLRRADRQPWAGDALRTASLGEGVQKYVLMRASEAGAGTGPDGQQRSKLIVWGHPAAAYHMNVLERCKAEARKLGLNVEPLGGGRIEHFESSGVIHVYGYSQAFGPAPHHVSAAILRRMFPFYDPDSITVSYEGY